MEDAISNRRVKVLAGLVFLLMAIMGMADLWNDGSLRSRKGHVLLEVAFLLLCLGAAVWLFTEVLRQVRKAGELQKVVHAQTAERDAWRAQAQDYLRGLGEAIARQCRQWKLTPAESEVALLLLKGFSSKEIALLQDRSERTVRQHAIAVYRKAQLSGRAELSAFFLEDLLLPQGVASTQDNDIPEPG
jgi:DNA-binding CsgD family transcriptional regulator